MKAIKVIFSSISLVMLSVVLYAQPLVWAKGVGGIGGDFGTSVAVDASGNTYITGYFQMSVDFDPGSGTTNLSAGGGEDMFVLKLNSSGNFVWAKRIGGTGYERALGIALDINGNPHITGYFSGTVDFDPGSATFELSTGSAYFDAFVLKLDPQGNFVWAKKTTGSSNEAGNSISIDDSGNIYTTGYFSNTADFDPGPDTLTLDAYGTIDVFVSKLDASGNLVWAFNAGANQSNGGNAVITDNSGNVYVAGYFEGTGGDFDPGPGVVTLYGPGLRDIFVSKYNSSGSLVWVKPFASSGGSYTSEPKCISVDGSGNVLVTGVYSGTVDFDPGAALVTMTSAGTHSDDIFVLKLDGSGNYVWAKSIGSTGSDIGYSITTDAGGHIYSVGSFSETCDFDPGAGTSSLTSSGGWDVFISILGSNGNFINALSIGGTDFQYAYGTCLDPNGSILITGGHRATTDFDPGSGTTNLTSNFGSADIYVCKLGALTAESIEGIENSVTIYPNPANEKIFVNTNDLHTDNFNVTITDLRGITVYTSGFSGSQTEISLTGLAKGMYIVTIESGRNILHKKIDLQ